MVRYDAFTDKSKTSTPLSRFLPFCAFLWEHVAWDLPVGSQKSETESEVLT